MLNAQTFLPALVQVGVLTFFLDLGLPFHASKRSLQSSVSYVIGIPWYKTIHPFRGLGWRILCCFAVRKTKTVAGTIVALFQSETVAASGLACAVCWNIYLGSSEEQVYRWQTWLPSLARLCPPQPLRNRLRTGLQEHMDADHAQSGVSLFLVLSQHSSKRDQITKPYLKLGTVNHRLPSWPTLIKQIKNTITCG